MNQPPTDSSLSNDQIEELLSQLLESLPVPLESLPSPLRIIVDTVVRKAKSGDLEPLSYLVNSMQQMDEDAEGDADDARPMTPQESFPLSNPAAAMTLFEVAALEKADERQQIAAVEKAIEQDATSVEAIVMLGELSAANQKMQYFQQAGEAISHKDPEDVTAAMPWNRLRMASDLCGQGDWANAATILLPALKEDPFDDCEARFLLTELTMRLGWDDELSEIVDAYENDSFGTIPFAKAFLTFKQEGATPRSNALLKVADEMQPGVIGAIQVRGKPDAEGYLGEADFVAQCLLPGIREIPGAMAWMRETVESDPLDIASRYPDWDDEEAEKAHRDPIGFAIELPTTDELWRLMVVKLETSFSAVIFNEEMELIRAEIYAKRPGNSELRELLMEGITDPVFGERKKPGALIVANKAHANALTSYCATFDIGCRQEKFPTEMTKAIKVVLEGFAAQDDAVLEQAARDESAGIQSAGHESAGGVSANASIDIASLPQCDETWLFSVFQPPMWIHDRATPWRPWMYLVQRASDGVILKTESLEEEPSHDAAVSTIQSAMASPMIERPRRPAQILCDPKTPLSIESIVSVFDEEDVDLQMGDESLSEFFAKVVSDMLEFNSPVKGSLLGQDDVDAAYLTAFYEEAARFYQTAPWKMVPGDRLFEIHCDAWKNPRWVGCVIGQLGQELGLAIYDSPSSAIEFMKSEDTAQMNALMLHFGEAFDTIPQDLWNLERHEWKVASAEAYPFISRVVGGKGLVCPTAEDLVTLLTAMRHTARFLDHPAAEPLVVKGTDGHPVTFSWID